MPNLLSIEALKADRLYVQKQIEKAPGSKWGTERIMWQQRLAEIDRKINQLGVEAERQTFASVALIFDGLPVIGQGDIRLDFSAESLSSYQKLVAATLATQNNQNVNARGKMRGAEKSKLFIRDLVRGSMGFLLEELPPEQGDMFPTPLKIAVDEVTRLIDTLAHSTPEVFDETIEQLSPRVVGAVQKFTKVLKDAGATTKIVADGANLSLGLADVNRLSSLFNEVTVTEEEATVEGILMGILPEAHEFEMQLLEETRTLTGTVGDDLVAKYVADQEFKDQLLLKPVVAQIRYIYTARSGKTLKTHTLLENLEPKLDSQSIPIRN